MAAERSTRAPDTPSPHVLFLDDDSHFLGGMRRALRELRHTWTLEFLQSPTEALERLEQLDTCILVVDWRMPVMDGPSVCAKARALLEKHPDKQLYLILLTGMDGPDRAAEALENGADDFVAKPVQTRELIARLRVGWRLLSAQHELWLANAQLSRLATTDPLTNLYNRRAAEEALDKELARVQRSLNALTVGMIDLDHFKQVNDTYGHGAGDAVLSSVAQTLQRTQREYDRTARWGGEEFLVICPDHGLAGGEPIGQRICAAISSHPIDVSTSKQIQITASIGIVTIAAGVQIDRTAVVEAADRELYRAKQGGRNQACATQIVSGSGCGRERRRS